MNKRIIALLALLCLICVVFWWNFRVPAKRAPDGNEDPGPTNTPDVARSSSVKNPQKPSPVTAPAAAGSSETRTTAPWTTDSNAFYQWWLRDGHVPIEFYGRVIDEKSNAVAGASVNFTWHEDREPRGHNTVSDADGLFSLQGARGKILEVAVGKEGYYTPQPGFEGFRYAASPRFSPDPQNPIIFRLRKKGLGVELITSENGMRLNVDLLIPRDNTPVWVDLLQKKSAPVGQLEISQIKPPWKDAKEWSFRMSIPDGGLAENDDEFQFEAPETSYQPSVEYRFTKDETNWITQATKQFYIAFGKPRTYGWLRIQSNLDQQTVFLTYAINPTGSRNLEPANLVIK